MGDSSSLERIYLSPPHIGETELPWIQDAFQSNWISTVGPHIDKFEEMIREKCNAGSVALSSGTAAIHLALRILGVKPGDSVACQSFTFAGSVNPVIYLGADPILIDSESSSWNIDPNLLEEYLKSVKKSNELPKAIVAVHLYGMPYDVSGVQEIANQYEIPVVEDAAEALGSIYDGSPCGGLGDFGILSFNGNKIITTSGGGALLSHNPKWLDEAKFLATQAREKAPHYEHKTFGYNYRMGNINAALGIGQIESLDDYVQKRRKVFDDYNNALSGYPVSFQEESDGNHSNRWLTSIITDSFEIREKIRLTLENENIESRPLWKPMHLQPLFEGSNTILNGNSADLFKRGLCLPSGSSLEEPEFNRIAILVKSVLEEN